jgi:CubicO group peptidase (beta-lactamase class C family)
MADLGTVREWLPGRLEEVARKHRVPGASIAVLAGDEVVEAATGVVHKGTGVPATADAIFQIGSITKVWTATLVMQLVDEGKLDLDAPVRTYLPEFKVADGKASEQITVRQLTCHTSGFEGDIFTDTGRGDDAIEKYVATLDDVPQLFEPGGRFSYNNAGYVVLGRIVEVLRGKPFGTVLREHIAAPLGLDHLATDAYEAILHRAAVGHIEPEPGADPVPAPVWALAASNAPAGSMLSMSAADLLAFARMHLAGGKAPDGTQVLSDTSAKAMRKGQVDVPFLGGVMAGAWGIGWEIFDWHGTTVIGHDGGTIGQAALLRVVPSQGVAVALLTNGGDPSPTFRELVGPVLADLAGARLPAEPEPPATTGAVDPDRYVGRYESKVATFTVADENSRLWLTVSPSDVLAEAGSHEERFEIVQYDGDVLISKERQHGRYMVINFVAQGPDGRPAFLHHGRAVPRASG